MGNRKRKEKGNGGEKKRKEEEQKRWKKKGKRERSRKERTGGVNREGGHNFWASESASTDAHRDLFILTLQVGINTYIALIKTFCKSKPLGQSVCFNQVESPSLAAVFFLPEACPRETF